MFQKYVRKSTNFACSISVDTLVITKLKKDNETQFLHSIQYAFSVRIVDTKIRTDIDGSADFSENNPHSRANKTMNTSVKI